MISVLNLIKMLHKLFDKSEIYLLQTSEKVSLNNL